MALPQEYLPILGPITAAIIAGSISFIITVLSKDQKTSEFRQAWIDALRNEISELLSLFHILHSILIRKQSDGESESKILEYAYSRQDDFVKVNNLATKIRLRLNPNEHGAFLVILDKLEKNSENMVPIDENEHLIKEAIQESQKVLKKEWGRVKSGELSFRLVKWASLATLLAASFIAVLYISNHLTIAYIP